MSYTHLAVFRRPGMNSSLRYVYNDVIYSHLGACGNVKYAGPQSYLYLRNWCVVPIADRA